MRTGRAWGYSYAAVAGALLCTAAAPGQIQPSGYTCSGTIARTNNNSLAITHRLLVCALPTSVVHYWDLSSDPNMAGQYTTLKCVDWSLWSSANLVNQTVFVRVWQDLAPGRDETTNCADTIDETQPGPSAADAVLLWVETEVFPPSTNGTTSLTVPRPDGDRSTIFVGPTGGGVLLAPDSRFYIELLHLGEAVTRFGCNQAGEAGDGDPADPRVTWMRSFNCNGGGCSDGTCNPPLGSGSPPCTSNPIVKWSEFAPNPDLDRDVVMQVHFRFRCEGYPAPPPYSCFGDLDNDFVVGVSDLLELLGHWGTFFVRPECPHPFVVGDYDWNWMINVTDLLDMLALWGPCPNPIDECAELVQQDFSHNIVGRVGEGDHAWTIDGLLDGPPRPSTNNFDDILSGPTECGWHDYGAGGIPGGFRWGDAFGIDAATGAEGGDVWFLYGHLRRARGDHDPGRMPARRCSGHDHRGLPGRFGLRLAWVPRRMDGTPGLR